MKSLLSVIYCLLFVIAVVLCTLAIYALFSRWWKKRHLPASNEFTGIMFGAISLVYTLIIAFAIVAVWEDYEELNQTVEQEADKINNIIAHAAILPDSLKRPIHHFLASYCTTVIDKWEAPAGNHTSQASALPDLRLMLLHVQPQGHFQENLFDILDDDLSNISDLRRKRLDHVRSHVPTLVWLILLVGSILIILFSFFVSTESVLLKRIGISMLAALMGMSLFLVYALDHPFTSSMQVSYEPYQKILSLLKESK